MTRTWTWCAACQAHFDTPHEDHAMPSRQTFIAGTEPPGRDEKIEHHIELVYEAKAAQKEAAEVTAIRVASLLEAVVESGRDVYPFLEPETGRRKILDVTAIRKARVKRAVSEKQEAADREFDAGSRAPAGPRLTSDHGALPPLPTSPLEKMIDDACGVTVAREAAGAKPGKRKGRSDGEAAGAKTTGSVARGRAGKGSR